jgi:cell division protein FtsB
MVIVGVLAAAVITGWAPIRDIGAQRAELAEAEAEFARLQEQNAYLEERLEALADGIEIERIAREELGYVLPDEEAFVVVDPGSTTSVPEEPTVTQESFVSHPWYKKVWDWLTGADLVNNS